MGHLNRSATYWGSAFFALGLSGVLLTLVVTCGPGLEEGAIPLYENKAICSQPLPEKDKCPVANLSCWSSENTAGSSTNNQACASLKMVHKVCAQGRIIYQKFAVESNIPCAGLPERTSCSFEDVSSTPPYFDKNCTCLSGIWQCHLTCSYPCDGGWIAQDAAVSQHQDAGLGLADAAPKKDARIHDARIGDAANLSDGPKLNDGSKELGPQDAANNDITIKQD